MIVEYATKRDVCFRMAAVKDYRVSHASNIAKFDGAIRGDLANDTVHTVQYARNPPKHDARTLEVHDRRTL